MNNVVVNDVCENKHGGDAESTAAFQTVNRHQDRTKILNLIIATEKQGATLDELSVVMQRAPNQISGRITELKVQNKIISSGTRKTRTGCTAKVYVAC